MPEGASAVERKCFGLHTAFNEKDCVMHGRHIRIFSWGYEMWGMEPLFRPERFLQLGVCTVVDEAPRLPPLPLRCVKLGAATLNTHSAALSAECILTHHPFIDTALYLAPDALDPSTHIIVHSTVGDIFPQFLTPKDGAAVARQMLAVVHAFDGSGVSFGDKVRWCFGRVKGQLLVRLADVSNLVGVLHDEEVRASERRVVGSALLRLIVANSTPEESEEWRDGSVFVAMCRTLGVDALLEHRFITDCEADGDADHKSFLALVVRCQEGWIHGEKRKVKVPQSSLRSQGIRYMALLFCEVLQKDGWHVLYTKLMAVRDTFPNGLFEELLRMVMEQSWRLADCNADK